MSPLPTTSSATRAALVYITVGALLVIWSTIGYIYVRNHNYPAEHSVYYWGGGCFASGLVLVIIGLGVGRIGGSARQADVVHSVIAPPNPSAARDQPITALVNPLPDTAAEPPPQSAVPVTAAPQGAVPENRPH